LAWLDGLIPVRFLFCFVSLLALWAMIAPSLSFLRWPWLDLSFLFSYANDSLALAPSIVCDRCLVRARWSSGVADRLSPSLALSLPFPLAVIMFVPSL